MAWLDYDPITGKASGFDDGVEAFPIEEREDGIYVGLPAEESHISTVEQPDDGDYGQLGGKAGFRHG